VDYEEREAAKQAAPQLKFRVILESIIKNASLVTARENLGLSPKSAAKQIGVSYQRYLDIENLRYYPDQDVQKKVCEFYRINGIFLFEDDVFPDELKNLVDRPKKIVSERSFRRDELKLLSDLSQKEYTEYQRLEDYRAEPPDSRYKQNELSKRIIAALKTLSDREREVIVMRYFEGLIYEDIARRKGLTRERVRQIEANAIRKLQSPWRARRLVEFVN